MIIQHKTRKGTGWGTVYILKAYGRNIFKYGATRDTDLSGIIRSARLMFNKFYSERVSFKPFFAVCTKDPFGVENALKWELQDTYGNPDGLVPIKGEFIYTEDTESTSHIVHILKVVSYGRVG